VVVRRGQLVGRAACALGPLQFVSTIDRTTSHTNQVLDNKLRTGYSRLMETVTDSLGGRIRDRRTFHRMTQQALGEHVGRREADISRYERDKVVPETMTLLKIAKVLNTTAEWLVNGGD